VPANVRGKESIFFLLLIEDQFLHSTKRYVPIELYQVFPAIYINLFGFDKAKAL
jgi:hypothetical protein